MKSIEQQTGWKRPYPHTLCQDYNVLLSIHDFDFDPDNDEFIRYFISRTGIAIKDYYLDRGKSNRIGVEPRLVKGPGCGWKAVKSLLTDPGDDIAWRITRAKMQDCWELYTQQQETTHGKIRDLSGSCEEVPVQAGCQKRPDYRHKRGLQFKAWM